MIERELYIKVLDCLHDEQYLAKKVQMIQERDFQVIGDVIINMLLEEIAEVDITQIKQIICMNLRYSQEQYSRLTYEELCVLVCEHVIRFKTYPADEYQKIEQNYDGIKNKYYSIIAEIENEMLRIDDLIKIDKEHPQCCGSLIKKQNQLQARNNVSGSLVSEVSKTMETMQLHAEG